MQKQYDKQTLLKLRGICSHRHTRPVGFNQTSCERCGAMFAVNRG